MEEYFGCRRQYRRVPCSLRGRYLTGDDLSHKIHCKDISVKGARVVSPLPLPVRSSARLEVDAKRAGKLTLEGEVRWCRKEGGNWQAGITFDRELATLLNNIV